jgi:Flp pilus assembly pilin Flp
MEKRALARRARGLLVDERGLTTVEYIIILCLIAVVCFAMWKQFGQTVEYKAKGASRTINQLPTTSSP